MEDTIPEENPHAKVSITEHQEEIQELFDSLELTDRLHYSEVNSKNDSNINVITTLLQVFPVKNVNVETLKLANEKLYEAISALIVTKEETIPELEEE
jgi:hypothetical protein